jgi:hypothetical protein
MRTRALFGLSVGALLRGPNLVAGADLYDDSFRGHTSYSSVSGIPRRSPSMHPQASRP